MKAVAMNSVILKRRSLANESSIMATPTPSSADLPSSARIAPTTASSSASLARPHGATKTLMKMTKRISCFIVAPHRSSARYGPECSKERASSIIPNSFAMS
jgi:hypothetical protein